MRVRGLKLLAVHPQVKHLHVAPHAGAGIETSKPDDKPEDKKVAPHAGAGIETPRFIGSASIILSHPMRVRGLKPYKPLLYSDNLHVAPHAGAGIET